MNSLHILVATGGLHLILLFAHGTYIALSSGLAWGTGRRDTQIARSDLRRRFDRTVTNNVESLVAFVPVMTASLFFDASSSVTMTAGMIYLLARIAFSALYLANVPYVRTFAWFCGQLATGTIVLAMCFAQTLA